MTRLCFPDVNVWLALALGRHVFHSKAAAWWEEDDSDAIGFCRLTQIGLLRQLTTAATMGGHPLTDARAWAVYDKFFEDARVKVFTEVPPLDDRFRGFSSSDRSSPKIWADCYLAAHAAANRARLVTFDRAFANYGVECLVLG